MSNELKVEATVLNEVGLLMPETCGSSETRTVLLVISTSGAVCTMSRERNVRRHW